MLANTADSLKIGQKKVETARSNFEDSYPRRIELLVHQAHRHIREHEPAAAANMLEQALTIDFDDTGVLTLLKYVNFWIGREDALALIDSNFEKGEYLITQWRQFDVFIERIGNVSEQHLYPMRQHVFGRALEFFITAKEPETDDIELQRRISRCYKGIGNFEQAMQSLQQIASRSVDNSALLAELGDCYALVNEPLKAKALLREAFFIDPTAVVLEDLESELVRQLVKKVSELGHNGVALKEWLPVYGVIWGVLSVKRELRPVEYGILNQSIYALESEYGQGKQSVQIPRLLNRYFWLIDHYTRAGAKKEKIDEILLKIRSIDGRIYRLYVD